MKISKKLMISNILINIIAMGILGLIISNTVGIYIKKDIEGDLIIENNRLVKVVLSKGRAFLDEDYNISKYLTEQMSAFSEIYTEYMRSIIFDINDTSEPIAVDIKDSRNKLTENEINTIVKQDAGSVYTIVIDNKSYLSYNGYAEIEVKGTKYELLLTTIIPDTLGDSIKSEIIKTLIITISIISLILIILTSYNEKMITKPIKKLIYTTERIGEKDFDQIINLNTKDEFEILANAINKMSYSLKKQDIEQKKFYQNISHELKTPLTIISGYAQGVKNNVFEDQDKILDTIVNECNNFKKQLENLIYLSKLDTINETYNFKDNSLNNLIIDSLEKVDSIIILNEINIIYNPSEDIIIKVDKEKILRALTNILSNCLKYTKDTIYVNTKKLDNEVEIQIYDNGNGFSEELLEKPFSGVVVGTKEGNGIGLSIIKKVIDTHNGSIRLENEKDYGAKYIIKLPI
ncbi:HAMP domain-containing sensor histidine kinase [Romboutsia sedimentorum]|uniref:HAMP domain-containing sensor histidine kinase n=1 Tax=Romboutsia sedimentorum TaxID=1368474 RepID=UPI0024DEF563|nr:HAMP domain-containing sensor histidine kinase [Romboutsia sedimentorum]MDK2587228.1 HAMP domain-containing sensor histidine kinase [Romboutsia sedimentorum]